MICVKKMKKIIKMFHLVSLVLTFILKLQFSADTSRAEERNVFKDFEIWKKKIGNGKSLPKINKV